jgi:hypothetical protein
MMRVTGMLRMPVKFAAGMFMLMCHAKFPACAIYP